MKRFLILVLLIGLNFSSLAFADPVNTVTLTSYYPAPFGAYDRMRLVPRATLGVGTCTAANEGTLYIPDSTFAINQCRAGMWVPIGDGLWQVQRTSANARFDSIADIDQYFLRNFGSYWNVDVLQPYVGIGTNDPTTYLHIFRGANDPAPGVSPTFIRLQNQSGVLNPTPGIGPGGKIAFAGAGGDNVILHALYNKLTPPAGSSLGFLLRDGVAANPIEQFRMMGNGYFGIRDTAPSAILELAGNATYPPLPSITNSLPYLMISTNNQAARNGDVLTVTRDGNVGINMLLPALPTEKLDVNGNIRATTLILTSDAALKKDIAPVRNALDKISHLNGVSFEWKDKPTDHRKHIGVLAQDVEKIFPESVYGQEGSKSVDYPSLIAPLIEAVKELKNQNQAMGQQLKAQSLQILEQQQQIESLKNSRQTKNRF